MYENQYSTLSNSLNIQLENDISVITLNDNIRHTYWSKIIWEKDMFDRVGTARLIIPYSKDIEKYWVKYSGPVVIHANLNSHTNKVLASQIQNSNKISLNLRKFRESQVETEEEETKSDTVKKLRFKNDEYNYSFIGKTYKFKQVGKTFMIYLEDIGWKFMQKVPKEFRDAYISNQRLDDAFQAICEFIGVDFAYSIEDLSEYNFAADGYSIEKDGTVIENVPSILKEWSNSGDEEDEEMSDDEISAETLKDGNFSESSGLNAYRDSKKKSKKTNNNTSTDNALNSQVTNQEENSEESEDEKEKDSSADVSDKIKQYQEEFDDKIKDLFIGNIYYESNVSDPIMNYDWITIEPKAPPTDSATTGTSTGTTSGSGSDSSSSQSNQTAGTIWDDLKLRPVNNSGVVLNGIIFTRKVPNKFGLF